MASNDEAEKRNEERRRPSLRTLVAPLAVVLLVILSAWALMTVSTAFQVPPTDFVQLPTSPLSNTGQVVMFVATSAINQKGEAVGVKGYLETVSGQPVAGAKIYAQYYFEYNYRTQAAATDQNGYFEIHFPMNWTGGLPLTLTYFGDNQHEGLKVVYSLSGESL